MFFRLPASLDKVNDLADTVLIGPKTERGERRGSLVTIEGKPKNRRLSAMQVNPAAVAGLGIGLEDIRSALVNNNVNIAKEGQL